MYFEHFRLFYTSDSNKRSIGNHFFKVLVQIHYSQGPSLGGGVVILGLFHLLGGNSGISCSTYTLFLTKTHILCVKIDVFSIFLHQPIHLSEPHFRPTCGSIFLHTCCLFCNILVRYQLKRVHPHTTARNVWFSSLFIHLPNNLWLSKALHRL